MQVATCDQRILINFHEKARFPQFTQLLIGVAKKRRQMVAFKMQIGSPLHASVPLDQGTFGTFYWRVATGIGSKEREYFFKMVLKKRAPFPKMEKCQKH